MLNNISRRTALETLGVTLAAGTILHAAPSETIRIGCIGTGGRCRTLMKSLLTIPNTSIVAISDIRQDALAQAKAMTGDKVAMFSDYRKLLEDKNIDAVLIGSPDHWHVPMTIDAVAAGKDVYVENISNISSFSIDSIAERHRTHQNAYRKDRVSGTLRRG